MSGLNKDVILLILEELKNDIPSLYSCLLVNRFWCEITAPILWKNPFNKRRKITVNARKILFNVILSHLSEESRDYLKIQGIDLFKAYRRPLFNYIGFWRHLNLRFLEYIMKYCVTNFELSKKLLIGNEIMKLFVTGDSKFVSLTILGINLCLISGTERCFSELEHFNCGFDINSNILERLATTSTSIKKLSFNVHTNNSGIVRLIEAQKNLKKVNFINYSNGVNKLQCKSLEASLIKCVDTIRYVRIDWIPVTRFLSYLVNLVSLEIKTTYNASWNHLVNVNNLVNISLPYLKFLKAQSIPSNILANLIENTKGCLIRISILNRTNDLNRAENDKKLIQKIYQNCPNLNYLKLRLSDNEFSEFENLLINCQSLIGLEIVGYNTEWDRFFKILKFSQINLFKFKFTAYVHIWEHKFEHLKLFLNDWKGRQPMLLHIITIRNLLRPIGLQQQQHEQQELRQRLKGLLQEHKVGGIIKRFDVDRNDFREFEWI
ncbi:hypothetical protein RclHR1_14550004 [Rhizophagus clarus]|uniref:F-box domain-containing protein n=1 Tax=Rhizophagus clarus TaxID=94130 RepID=A0A2Z6QCV3_9GLOM|nr:hypothetical protein RclHR1_14550004 [Rhizophagus clarus]GES99201.1 hypothetical protein GLOIN_2v1885583 [Rhizophagus clarus]